MKTFRKATAPLVTGFAVSASLSLLISPAQAQDDEGTNVEDEAVTAPVTGAEIPEVVATPQEVLPPPPPVPTQESDAPRAVGLNWSVRASSEVVSYDNRDLRERDETTDQAIVDTDDRRTFGYSDINFTLGFRPSHLVGLDSQFQYNVLWKEDQLGRQAGTSGSLGVYQLNALWEPFNTDDLQVQVRVGRQAFTIGGVPRDYFLQGTADAVTALVDLRQYGALRILGFEIFGSNDLPETGYQFYRSGRQTLFGQRGETNTYRVGGVYELDPQDTSLGIMARAYFFHASVGGGAAGDTGSDLSYGGALGNFRDADYQRLFGGRLGWSPEFEGGYTVSVYGEFGRSDGIDRKELVARDVDTSGNAFGGGLNVGIPLGSIGEVSLAGSYYHFDGGNYASDGLEFERGFVGFKGARVGGLAIGRLAAWRPSAHLDTFGVRHGPHDESRAAGTAFAHAELGMGLMDTQLKVAYWHYTDTSSTFLDVANLNTLPAPPFGYTVDEFAAQARNGETLGQEIEVELSQTVRDMLRMYAGYGVFLPGSFYETAVSRTVAGDQTALGGTATFWAVRVGAEVYF